MSENNEYTLDRVQMNCAVIVRKIDGGLGIRKRLNTIGIHRGDIITVKRSGIMRGPILVKVHGMEVAIGRGMAAKIIISDINQ